MLGIREVSCRVVNVNLLINLISPCEDYLLCCLLLFFRAVSYLFFLPHIHGAAARWGKLGDKHRWVGFCVGISYL